MTVGVLTLLYSIALIEDALNKVEVTGGTFTLIAGIFLALICLYPSGTRPHVFMSVWFCVQADLATVVWGFELLLRGWRVLGASFTVLGVLGPLMAMTASWPSVAVLEAFGIALIDVWIILMLKVHAARL